MFKIRSIAYLYAFAYLNAYIICYILDSYNGKLSGDLTALNILIYEKDVYFLLNISNFLLGIILLLFLLKINSNGSHKSKYFYHDDIKKNNIDIVILAIALFALYSMAVLRVNTILKYDLNNFTKIEVFLANINYLFQPIYLVPLYLYYRLKNISIYYIFTTMIYIVLVILSGFMGNLLLLLPLIVSRINKKIYISLFLIISLIALPLVRIMKWIYVTSFDNISIVLAYPLKSIIEVYLIILGHFNLAANAYYFNKINDLTEIINLKESLLLRQNYLFFMIDKIFTINNNSINLGTIFAFHINKKDTWSAAVPLINYISGDYDIAIINFLTVIFSIYLFVYILKKYLPSEIRLLFGVIAIFELIMGGWIAPFYQLVQAAFMFYFIVFLCNRENTN